MELQVGFVKNQKQLEGNEKNAKHDKTVETEE